MAAWQDHALEVLEFHESKCKEHGTPTPSNSKTGWSLRDTASHYSVSAGSISYELRLARELRKDPDKFKGITKNQAIKNLNPSLKLVEIRNARSFFAGRLIMTFEIEGFMYYVIKPEKRVVTDFFDFSMVVVPAYHCRFISEQEKL